MASRACRRRPTHPDGRGAGPAGRNQSVGDAVRGVQIGGRSAKVSDFLARNGFEPVNVNGGMLAWAEAGRAVVTDDGSPGSI